MAGAIQGRVHGYTFEGHGAYEAERAVEHFKRFPTPENKRLASIAIRTAHVRGASHLTVSSLRNRLFVIANGPAFIRAQDNI